MANRLPSNRVVSDISAGAAYRLQIEQLEAQLSESREMLEAIRNGEVDAVVVGEAESRRVYTLEGADRSYRLLIEQMREGAVMLSAEAVVLYGNAALADLLGVPPERLLGHRFRRFVCEGDRQVLAELLSAGGTAEISLRRPSGEVFPARLSLGQLTTDAGPVMCGVITDLTAANALAREISDARSRLAVETAGREIDERYRLILESATDFAILSTDFEGRVTIWNAGARNILGWSADEVIGGPAPTIWSREDRAAGAPQQEMATALHDGRAEAERWQLRRDGSRFWANSLMMPLRNQAGDAIGFLKILRDRTEQRRATENQQTLINELNHRVKNTLSTVQSIATQTLRTALTPADAREALEDRLIALSMAHDVLTRERWESAELSEIVAAAMAAYGDRREHRIEIAGPEVRLPPRVALALSMALHELSTNAVKYGALSNSVGEVSIRWSCHQAQDSKRLRLVWSELGGPLVQPPRRQGFGTRLIRRTLAAELGGEVTMDFAATGVVCVIDATVEDAGLDFARNAIGLAADAALAPH
jgi:PAS domain S-box-containing protein